jgi:hypothetical protein
MNEVERAMIVEHIERNSRRPLGVAVLLLASASFAPAAGAAEDGGYSYARTLEGTAVITVAGGDREDLELNQPILAGDRVTVPPRSRLEVALSDHTLLRIDGDSSLIFQALAGSPDREDRATVIELEHGNLQWVIERDALGTELPRIETGNATLHLVEAGVFRITADGDWTELTVRRGEAEVVAGREDLVVGAGESVVVDGWRDAAPRIRVADREDPLERWGHQLDREAEYASDEGDLDPSLRYRAASLSRHGRWDSVEGRRVWIPRVAADWRPYHAGRWVSTPLGLTWVSYENWGWVPYHYGTWDYLPGYGWAWYPGRTFGPSWVYWYWTNDYAAWIPTGYYVRYYGNHHGRDHGFRWGVYGWAGGSWDYYDDWNFCNTRYIGRRDQHHNTRRGDRVAHGDRRAVPRGILTTDTRDITRDRLRRPAEIVDTLAARRRHGDGDLPDVTPFVARRGELPKEVRNEILVDRETRRRGTERILPDDSSNPGGAMGRPGLDTTAGTPERERRARGRAIESRTPDLDAPTPATSEPGEPTARERRPRSPGNEATRERARRLETASPARPSTPTAKDEPDGRTRRVYRPEAAPPKDPPSDAGSNEIRSRRREPENPPAPPATADRPPVRRVIEGARRNHPPTPPPAPSGGTVSRERSKERERSVDTAGRSREAAPDKAPESPPPKSEGERRRRPRPPGE